MMLTPGDFAAFFEEVHGHEPFPWQKRLFRQITEKRGEWPETLALPTGSGKTAAIDIAVFHLALEADRGEARRAPVRIAFVVDRRLVVDDSFERAEKIAEALASPQGPTTTSVAERLKKLSGDGPPLIARRLRGGIPLEDDWARTPSQPTVLCSTVDQVGSRLLFRGYGVSDSMKPVHAGLIGSDCLILLDEAHLAEPFRQTLGWLRIYQEQNWREVESTAPRGVALLTATPGEKPQDSFSLDDEDKAHPVLEKRLNASKPARLIAPTKLKGKTEDAAGADDDETESSERDLIRRAAAIVKEVRSAFEHFKGSRNGVLSPAIGVVINRVARAREVFKRVRSEFKEEIETGVIGEPILMIGPVRPLDRDGLVSVLEPIRTRTWKEGERRLLETPIILVATQCVEAGVDIDLDALVTEAAPLDSLRQRFGRLNRAGREITPYAAIIAMKSDVSARHDDPIYGKAIKPAWDCLTEAASKEGIVDFGLNAFVVRMEADALAPKADAPVLLPAHLDLLSQTSPIPAADPDIALYLHGPSRQPDSITIVWRADIDPAKHLNEETRRLLKLVPPRSAEAIELPIWAVRRWLAKGEQKAPDHLADVPTAEPEDNSRTVEGKARKVFRWKGDDERSRWIAPSELRPGDTIVAPVRYGGVDEFGWNPDSEKPATDVGEEAARPFVGRRFAARVAPGLIGGAASDEALAEAMSRAPSQHWRDLRAALLELTLPEAVREDLESFGNAKAGKVVLYTDLYGSDDQDRPRGVVFLAPFGIKDKRQDEDGQPNVTEDDAGGSMPGFSLSLEEHSQDVEKKAETFAKAAGLPGERVTDLKLAGRLHDAGKVNPRFQAWLQYGDPLGPEPDRILATSGRSLPRTARDASGLPENWRHEALSVRLARADKRLREANDPELVLWLIGTHHGHGRPFFPHRDPAGENTRHGSAVARLRLAGSRLALSLRSAQGALWRVGTGPHGGRPAARRPSRFRGKSHKGGHRMTVASYYRLEGLEPDNLLAFLALLGLLRVLETADRERSEKDKLRPRAAWDVDAPPLRPKLFLARGIARDEVTDSAAQGLDLLAAAHDFGGRKDLNHSQQECRALLEQEAKAAQFDARDHADLLAALMSDGAIKSDKETIDPTPLCLLFGQGHQHFLDRLASVPREQAPPPREKGKRGIVLSASECLGEALFQPWHRDDPTFSFRWDPEEDVRYALMAGDPTDAVYKAGTQHGANRLAAISLAALTLVPEMRAGRVRSSIIGGASGPDGFSFAWPIWRESATLSAIRALLAHRDLRKSGALAHLGVDHVMVARRISVGKFTNFARARPLAA